MGYENQSPEIDSQSKKNIWIQNLQTFIFYTRIVANFEHAQQKKNNLSRFFVVVCKSFKREILCRKILNMDMNDDESLLNLIATHFCVIFSLLC